ncbi:guanine nucleotide-binding protein G(I)/G(S)/G(O) subunit gamma-13 isoform X1 [Paroedura picta]|uniref:guanine nucleotide-binding protein G(I)/G(S)/G(O) subunit gamma-13 isoform X1 n=1 Tax=Paroedura picta TaxID=143630 RepID=UPI0040577316
MLGPRPAASFLQSAPACPSVCPSVVGGLQETETEGPLTATRVARLGDTLPRECRRAGGELSFLGSAVEASFPGKRPTPLCPVLLNQHLLLSGFFREELWDFLSFSGKKQEERRISRSKVDVCPGPFCAAERSPQERPPWMNGRPPSGRRKSKALSTSWLTSGNSLPKPSLNSSSG